MKILLVDDEQLQLIRLTDAVKKVFTNEDELLCYTNPVTAWEENKEKIIDIAFLDIEMPVINGIQLAKRLKMVNPAINIIFVTAYHEYAFDAYKIHASGYISKPVNVENIKSEIDNLRYPAEIKRTKKLQVKCFGNFDIYSNNVPVKFKRTKSKEVFAYLIDREGSSVNMQQLNIILWEDEDRKSYLRNIISDIRTTLKSIGAEDVFIKRRNECYIDPTKVDCDLYEYKKNNPDAVRLYRGEYMSQYDWAVFKDNLD